MRRHGFSILELMVVVAIVGALVAMGAPALRDGSRNTRLKSNARDLAGAIQLARAQAIRTQVNHVVMFGTTPSGNPLPAPALVLQDTDGDGEIDPGEPVTLVPRDAGRDFQGIARTTGYGKTNAVGVPADDPDPLGVFAGPSAAIASFRDPSGGNANQVLFQPDGIPRTYDPGPPLNLGNVGSGVGAIYLTNGDPALGTTGRDYAVIVGALGSVRVSSWDPSLGAWQ